MEFGLCKSNINKVFKHNSQTKGICENSQPGCGVSTQHSSMNVENDETLKLAYRGKLTEKQRRTVETL